MRSSSGGSDKLCDNDTAPTGTPERGAERRKMAKGGESVKTRWDVRAKAANDDVFRVHYSGVPFLRAIATAVRFMRKYDKVLISRNMVYGRRR